MTYKTYSDEWRDYPLHTTYRPFFITLAKSIDPDLVCDMDDPDAIVTIRLSPTSAAAWIERDEIPELSPAQRFHGERIAYRRAKNAADHSKVGTLIMTPDVLRALFSREAAFNDG